MTPLVLLSLFGFVIFGVIPLILALTADRWFWYIPLFGNLVQQKLVWDPENAKATGGSETIKSYRLRDDMGAKITVTHHLADVANDVKVQLTHGQLRTFVVTLLGFLLVFFAETNFAVQHPPTPKPQPGQTAPPAPTTSPIDAVVRVLAAYTLPIAAGASLFEALALLLATYNQARKYEGLLDPGRVARRGGKRAVTSPSASSGTSGATSP